MVFCAIVSLVVSLKLFLGLFSLTQPYLANSVTNSITLTKVYDSDTDNDLVTCNMTPPRNIHINVCDIAAE